MKINLPKNIKTTIVKTNTKTTVYDKYGPIVSIKNKYLSNYQKKKIGSALAYGRTWYEHFNFLDVLNPQ